MAVRTDAHGVMAEENSEVREQILELLQKAYWMEIETVMSYLAGSVNPDGVRAQEIKESLASDIEEELGHARQFANRIKELYGVVPGSLAFTAEQTYLQPAAEQTDVVHLIRGVIEAETGAIEHYNRIIEATDQGSILRNDIYDLKPMSAWSKARVTLLGDAAHPTTPGLGQGACQAIEDAVVLADSLSATAEIASALKAYESRRIPRARGRRQDRNGCG